MGGDGCGKTTLLEHLIPTVKSMARCGVLVGDLATSLDGERFAALGVPVVQLQTEGACHLDAGLVLEGLHRLPMDELDLVFIENVGNLVCPAEFDLGEQARLVVLSITEGDDKPAKYPLMFTKAHAVALTKTDLLKYTNFDAALARARIRRLNPCAKVFAFTHEKILDRNLTAWIADCLPQTRGALSATLGKGI